MKIGKIHSKINKKYKTPKTNFNHKYPISPNILNSKFNANNPGEVWVSDITYIEVGGEWMYLCIIMDLFNREIVWWHIDETLETSLLIEAFRDTVSKHVPMKGCIFHSDRGIQYASKEFRSILDNYNIIQSMSRKGDCWDNATSESFFKSLKSEKVYHVKYETTIFFPSS
jgi:putative transposase